MSFEPALRGYLENVARASTATAKAMIRDYAFETHLVRQAISSRLELTSIGGVFLRLRGKDAIRWLLTNEVVQSMGENDPWRAPQVLFEWLRDSVIGTAYHEATVDRLVSFGVLAPHDETGFLLRDEMRDVTEAVAVEGPWHAAIHALLNDEQALVIPGSPPRTNETDIAHTQLLIHEVRNALIPALYNLNVLQSASLEPAIQHRVGVARNGIVRTLYLVDAIADIIEEQSSRFELAELLREALSWVDTEHRVQWEPPSGSWQLQAPRTMLAHAISNVVRNALQATKAGQPVRVSVQRMRDGVRIMVDDGGPGVPVQHRQRVFEAGVSMGKGEGSGFGLAFTQHLVTGSLHGKIWCEDSDLGGARFVIELPQRIES